MAKKKTLYKIPTEDEIQGAVPATSPTTPEEKIVVAEKEVKAEEVKALPVKEPAPVAVVDTIEENRKLEAARKADAEAKEKKAAGRAAKKDALEAEKAEREAKKNDGYELITFARVAPRLGEKKEEKRKGPPPKVVQTLEARRELRKRLDITEIEGFSVGGRNVAEAKLGRRLARDRRRERIAKRETMKLMIAGEEQELSETSKYMLDMLIKNPTKKDQEKK